jgi:hypothetical protein
LALHLLTGHVLNLALLILVHNVAHLGAVWEGGICPRNRAGGLLGKSGLDYFADSFVPLLLGLSGGEQILAGRIAVCRHSLLLFFFLVAMLRINLFLVEIKADSWIWALLVVRRCLFLFFLLGLRAGVIFLVKHFCFGLSQVVFWLFRALLGRLGGLAFSSLLEFGNQVLYVFEVFKGFPGALIDRVIFPLDLVLHHSFPGHSFVEDLLHSV